MSAADASSENTAPGAARSWARAERDLVDRLTLEAANEGEALISAVRAAFCALVLARFLAIEPMTGHHLGALLVEVPLLTLAVAGSLATRRAARRWRFRVRGLVVASVADAGICFVSLLLNVLWPDDQYIGLLRMPDIAALLPVVFVSALRLTPAASVASVAATIAAFAALVGLDAARNGPRLAYGGSEVAMLGILLAAVGAAAWAAAHRARALVRRAGRESAQLGRARRHLDALLREHHDVRTLLSTARINLQLAQREPVAAAEPLAAVGQAIEQLCSFVEGVKSQAYAELAAIDGVARCCAARAVQVAAAVVQHRFPAVRVEASAPAVEVELAGGDRALSHVVFNLLCNACEGDGRRRARRVWLDAQAVGRELVLRVQDDGPGFLAEALAAPAHALASTKAGGSGIGLMLVGSLADFSGGRLELANRPEGGACVTLTLPLGA